MYQLINVADYLCFEKIFRSIMNNLGDNQLKLDYRGESWHDFVISIDSVHQNAIDKFLWCNFEIC